MKSKKVLATIVAVTTMAINISSMSAEAYSPTATRLFSVGPYSATASLYKDSTNAIASTSLSGGVCHVTLNYNGVVAMKSDPSYVSLGISGNASPASSSHTAAKDNYTSSTDMVYY